MSKFLVNLHQFWTIIYELNYFSVRIFLAIALQLAGFLLVAYAESKWVAILGIVSTSLSSGLGEASLLAYTSQFNKYVNNSFSFIIFAEPFRPFDRNVVSTWSSGTGGSGIIGSLSYAALISLGVSPVDTMLIMLSVPILEGVAFWLILRTPTKAAKTQGIDNTQYEGHSADTLSATDTVDNIKSNKEESIVMGNELSECDTPFGLKEKILYLPSLLKYIIPITLVYLLEYFINQGLVSSFG